MSATLTRLKSLISVTSEGVIVPKVGTSLSYSMSTGYRYIRINGMPYALHRILVAFRDNAWPDRVDHIDGNRLNNNLNNLRACTSSQNNCNRKQRSDNTLGYKGIFKRELKNRTVYGWLIKYSGYNESKSGFPTPEAAYKARCEAVIKAHGEFARSE